MIHDRNKSAFPLLVLHNYSQNLEVDRWQELIPVKQWEKGERESKLIDVSKIDKVPMEYFVHTNDLRCPLKDHALKMA